MLMRFHSRSSVDGEGEARTPTRCPASMSGFTIRRRNEEMLARANDNSSRHRHQALFSDLGRPLTIAEAPQVHCLSHLIAEELEVQSQLLLRGPFPSTSVDAVLLFFPWCQLSWGGNRRRG